MDTPREFDIILFGATGFTGHQASRYFAQHVPLAETRWALAGRNLQKLQARRAALVEEFPERPELARLELVLADAHDLPKLRDMCARTRVLLTTAGPFSMYGENLVRICIESRCDYVDITGETPWVRHLIDTYHARAERQGVRIINFCGVDSIPSDLMTLYLAREVQQKLDEDLVRLNGYFQMRGGFNGGTVASMFHMAETGGLAELAQPFLLNPGEERLKKSPKDPVGIHWDKDWWAWIAPFMMGPVNTRVVRRSEVLYRHDDDPYGANFSYQEYAWCDEVFPVRALTLSGVQMMVSELMQIPAVVKAAKEQLPQPGDGPSEESMTEGYVSVWFKGITASGKKIKAHFFNAGDPANHTTVKLLSESALMLVHNRDRLPDSFKGGILTPATGLGLGLVDRLRDAGVDIGWELF
jgi:short subunit dehydrogenase-like uncharacterized protein